ncbi:hypothetical protein [Nocardia amamiensis]|uniref:hypothetical protein n=1 Tax=Nocardia amamiensis TaxID=404578 RepID=UPI000AB80054|nr:hypothetical protein [Nocardia amamiensis]
MDSEKTSDGGARRAVVFSYSQTGQLTETVEAFTGPLRAAGWAIRHVAVEPARPYPFPWPVRTFFGLFPDCVDEHAVIDLATPAEQLRTEPGELVILAYQVWYLAPSLPVRTLLNDHPALFAGREVLSVIACRNMWYSAAVEVDRRLGDLGARHLGAIAAIDTRPQFVTLVTTLRWLLRGRRDGRGVFGRAGVDDRELDRIRGCGAAWADGAAEIDGARVEYPVAAPDLVAGRMFRRWGALIRAASRRSGVLRGVALTAFVCWLAFSLALMPLIALLVLPVHRRIDRAIDRTLAGITPARTGTPAQNAPAAPDQVVHSVDGAVPVWALSPDSLLLLFGDDAETAWRDALGYVHMMDTTPLAGIALTRTGAPDAGRCHDPSGAVIAEYGLQHGAAVLLRPGGTVAAALPGVDPHQELIRALGHHTDRAGVTRAD